MPPARRPRASSRAAPSSSAAAAGPRGGRGWLSTLRRDPATRPRRADDDGTPLTDELLLTIFAGVPDLTDLVRCAATCRRWRRLVSAEAAFLCRTPRRPPRRFITPLALGFFHRRDDAEAAAAPRFGATAFARHRFPGLLQQLQPPSLSTLFDDGLFDGSSHIVASRNGLLVVDLRRGKHDRALKLCVCNPMAGVVHVLPPLGGKDGLGHYACTALTADDRDEESVDPPRSSSYFRVVILYSRRGFTAFHSYSSDDGRWSEEGKVTSARLGKKQMGLTDSGVVGRGGRLVYWLAKNVVFVLPLETLQSTLGSMPWSGNGRNFDMANTLLGLSLEGRLCAIQFGRLSPRTANWSISIRIISCTDHSWLDVATEELIQVKQSLPVDVTSVRLQWFCEKSGVVFFSAVAGDHDQRRYEMYALNLKTKVVEKLVAHDRDGDSWGQVHGYEMDQVAYRASLAEPEGTEDI
ncbi:unnamed protein product [Urochloa decumbens]|uniref:F-box domain-containing protein n=1 Tax=Urochloa decumbens TaxID=240449 RepID=A0ABC9BYD2_9POAL